MPPIGPRDIESHERVHEPLLGPLERPALQWLAARVPARFGPDTMTVIGIVGAAVIFAAYALTNVYPAFLWLANLGFVINWFGDSLDGTLARYRRAERPKYGFFVDHTVDALSEALVFLGLGLSPFVRFDVACMGLVGYLMLSVYIYVRTAVDGVFKISYGGVGPTELRVLIVLANTAIFFFGNPEIDFGVASATVLDLVVSVVAFGLFAVFLTSVLLHALRLARLGE